MKGKLQMPSPVAIPSIPSDSQGKWRSHSSLRRWPIPFPRRHWMWNFNREFSTQAALILVADNRCNIFEQNQIKCDIDGRFHRLKVVIISRCSKSLLKHRCAQVVYRRRTICTCVNFIIIYLLKIYTESQSLQISF